MIKALQQIAEQRIAKAIEDGTLKIAGWKNKPLPLDDDAFVPDDLKMAYKILKNSGYVPTEVETGKEIDHGAAGPQVEMIRISQDDLGPAGHQVLRRQGLDGAQGPDRHEDGRVDGPVGRGHRTCPGPGVGTCCGHFKREHKLLFYNFF